MSALVRLLNRGGPRRSLQTAVGSVLDMQHDARRTDEAEHAIDENEVAHNPKAAVVEHDDHLLARASHQMVA